MSHSPAPAASASDWDSTLDGLETSLLAWEAWLEDVSGEPPDQWSPPSQLAPLTTEHVARAEALHRRYTEVSALAGRRLDEVRRERAQVKAPRTGGGYAPTPQSAYLDLEA
ncbi:hypothetical protein KLP28_14385 [Nocardioidaceae bacterium]|nr:hypothetical protein KLP28_14385 [Nocardioidaceae bacterium]